LILFPFSLEYIYTAISPSCYLWIPSFYFNQEVRFVQVRDPWTGPELAFFLAGMRRTLEVLCGFWHASLRTLVDCKELLNYHRIFWTHWTTAQIHSSNCISLGFHGKGRELKTYLELGFKAVSDNWGKVDQMDANIH